MTRPKVVFAILDAFPFRGVSRELTPVLHELREQGAWAPNGGRSILSASTYPNHATFVTGVGPEHHGIYTNRVLGDDGKFVGAEQVGPASPTLFDACRSAGRRAVAAFGDQNLVGVCGARSADAHWPPEGELPEDAPRGALNYGADRAVVAAVEELEVDSADLLVVQLDEVDTARHLHGPDTPEAREQFRATDAALGDLLEFVRPRWKDSVVIAVSDHDQEAVHEGAIDLAAACRERGLDVGVNHDGTSALIVGEVTLPVLRELPGVEDGARVGPAHTLVWGAPGQQFGIDWKLKAQHGSPRTRGQLAVVSGGHPAARPLAERVSRTSPEAADWAPTIRELLELSPA